MVIERREIWWSDLEEPRGSEPGFRRPVVLEKTSAWNPYIFQVLIWSGASSLLRAENDMDIKWRHPVNRPALAVAYWSSQLEARVASRSERHGLYLVLVGRSTGPMNGTWRSPVAHLNGVQGVAGSNPAVPTEALRLHGRRAFVVSGHQAGLQDSAVSRSEAASSANGTRRNRRFDPSA